VPTAGVAEIDELGEQFNEMAERLKATLTMLEADRDRLREFVADVSHELRTPIAALRTFVDLQREGELPAETRREFLERSSEQIRRLEWLSSNLLDLSRIDAGIFPLHIRPGDLRHAVGVDQAFLRGRQGAGMETDLGACRQSMFEERELENVLRLDQHEVTRRSDSDFADRAGIWTDVIESRGHQIVRDGYLTEAERAEAGRVHRTWVKETTQSQSMYLVSVEGTRGS
jgi:signal transduction histidine kinase